MAPVAAGGTCVKRGVMAGVSWQESSGGVQSLLTLYSVCALGQEGTGIDLPF